MDYIGTVLFENGRYAFKIYFPGPQINNSIPRESEWPPTHSGHCFPHANRNEWQVASSR
jgi:hypothetical protein